MRLDLVKGRPFRCTCLNCGRSVLAGDGYKVYADLDGKPFNAYYCETCTAKPVVCDPTGFPGH